MSTSSLVLHYAPDNASMVVRLALEEIGAPYKTSLVDRRAKAQRSADYLAINPNGLIPVLETDEGPIFETGAILLWLSERYEALAPPPCSAERGAFLKWLFFLSNTVHPCLKLIFNTEQYIGTNKEDQAKLRHFSQDNLLGHLQVLEEQWQLQNPAMLLDLYLAAMLRWTALYPAHSDKSWFEIAKYPFLHKTVLQLESRACVKTVQSAEGLGPKPFSAPRHADPPEGSAT